MRDLGRHRECDRTAAAAEVDRDRLGLGRGPKGVDGQLHDLLGLGARHEDAGSHRELERSERGPPGEVLQRLARRAAGDELVEGGEVGLVERPADHDPRLHAAAGEAEHVAEQQLRVDLGIGHPGRREACHDPVAHGSQVVGALRRHPFIHEMECNARDRTRAPP